MNNNAKTGVGFMSVVMVVLALCLAVFAVEGFMTSRTNRQISEKRCEYIRQYYKADGEAVKIYEKIRLICLDVTLDTMDKTLQINDIDGVGQVTGNGNDITVSYLVEINDSMGLQVELVNRQSEDTLNINKWEVVNTDEYNPDDSMKLWDGTFDNK